MWLGVWRTYWETSICMYGRSHGLQCINRGGQEGCMRRTRGGPRWCIKQHRGRFSAGGTAEAGSMRMRRQSYVESQTSNRQWREPKCILNLSEILPSVPEPWTRRCMSSRCRCILTHLVGVRHLLLQHALGLPFQVWVLKTGNTAHIVETRRKHTEKYW